MEFDKNMLKPGMVIAHVKDKSLDALGTLTTTLQGDVAVKHVELVLPNGKIATTGAKFGIVYGEVDAEKHLKGKSFFVLETLFPLPQDKLDKIQEGHEVIMKSGVKRLYGAWKFLQLQLMAIKNGAVNSISKGDPSFPI